MKIPYFHKSRFRSFTLVELLVVVAIIALLASLSQPAFRGAILKAQSIKCAENLRAIGNAVNLCINDNNNVLPQIDQAGAPIYQPPGSVQGIVGVLGPYGITTNITQCPVDMSAGTSSAFSLYKSSYEWDPIFDDENPNNPVVYGNPRGGATTGFAISPSRVRLCYDFNGIHAGKTGSNGTVVYQRNVLYGDGHISSH
jgi:prepilin-type N-terminal cleavage/methylation domain-containing protein/prepilin-type processing-associated H-X9-DG protein